MACCDVTNRHTFIIRHIADENRVRKMCALCYLDFSLGIMMIVNLNLKGRIDKRTCAGTWGRSTCRCSCARITDWLWVSWSY